MPTEDSVGALARQLAQALQRIEELEKATAVEVQRREGAEAALTRCDERLYMASLALQGVVFDWNPRSGAVERYGDLRALLGIELQDAPANDHWWQERVHPDDRELTSMSRIMQFPPDQTHYEVEFRIQHVSGSWEHACDRGYIMRDAQGAPVRVVGSTHSITGRKRLEARLQFQADILATTDAAVIAVDRQRVITYISPGAERLYGVGAAAMIGKPLAAVHMMEWMEGSDERQAMDELEARGTWTGENILIRADGSRRFISSTLNVLPPESGGGTVAVVRDISDKKQAELDFRKQTERLARANEDLMHFAYTVSHDLQAPLRTTISFSQLLGMRYRDKLDDRGLGFIQNIADAGNRMAALIADLLKLATSTGGPKEWDQDVPLSKAAAAAVENLGSEVRSTGGVIMLGELPRVVGNSRQFEQLFQNLIGNALKYRKPAGIPEVRLTAERGDGEWIVQVADNGIGFEASQASKIFGVFNRLHGTEYSGTGIGLAICKRIVDRRGGRIWATAEPGVGARFFFTVPDAVAEPGAAPLPLPEAVVDVPGAEAHFEELFQTIDLAQAIVRSMDGTIQIWTKGAERLFGWTRSEAVGRSVHQLLRTEFAGSQEKIEAKLLRDGEWKGELKKYRRDGTAACLATHWALYRDGSGRPQSVIEVVSDITALKDAEEARDLALRAGPMGIWRWDVQQDLVEWDETVERFHGLARDEFGRTRAAYWQRVHAADRELVQARMAEAIAHGPEFDVEYRGLVADGQEIWLRAQGQAVRDKGEVSGIIGVLWDISQKKRDELDRTFLLELSSALSRNTDAAGLAAIAVAGLGRHLGAASCVYGEAAGVLARHGDVPPEGGPTLTVPLDGAWLTITGEGGKGESALLREAGERLGLAIQNSRLLRLTQERQEQFEGTFELASVGIAHVSLDGRWLRANACLCGIMGYTREELLASRFQDMTYPDDLNSDLAQYAALQRGDIASYAMEKRYFHKNGSIIWANLTVCLMRDEDGAARYAISVIEDVTARKKAEQELEESNRLSELRLREIEAIYAQAPVGLLYLDHEQRFVKVNEKMAQLTGLSVALHLGRTLTDVLPELSQQMGPILRRVIASGKPVVNAEVTGSTPTQPGVERSFLTSYFPFLDKAGEVTGLNSVVQEITERKQTEAAWLEASERLYIAASSAQLGVFMWDASEDRAYWENQRMYDIVGRSREDGPVNTKEFLESVVHKQDAARLERALTNSVQSGQWFRHACRIFRQNDGALRHVEFSGQFEWAPNGSPLRLTGVMADITERVEAERSSLDRRQLLLRVLDSLFTFVGVMSPEGVLLEANRAPLEAAGIESAEVLGKFLPDTVWWSYDAGVQAQVAAAIRLAQEGETSRFDVRARMKDDQLVTLDFMTSPLRNENGEVLYLIASAVPIEERKRVEEALRVSEERYLLAEWATNDGLWDWDPVSDHCYFSPRFKALLGLEGGELLDRGEAIFERMHADDAVYVKESLREHFKEDRPYDVEVRVQMKDGGYRWFRSRGRAVRNHDGHVTRMVGAMSDIQDRKEAESVTRAQDEQLRKMIDSIEQLAWMAGPDGYIFWYNRRWYEFTGTTPQQMEGWGWRSVHDPKVLDRVMKVWLESLDTGANFEMEFPLRGRDGAYKSFLTRVAPVRNAQGEIVRWFGTCTNVDALRKEQDLLRDRERQFRELAETLPQIVWVANTEGTITYANPQLYSFTGLGRDDTHKFTAYVHPEDRAYQTGAWQRAVESGEHFENQSRLRRFDGVYRWFLHRAEPVRDDAGKVIKWLGTGTDIDDQKITEQALRRSNEDLEQFAYAASHDLQEPLRTVSIYSQLVWEKYGDKGGQAEMFARYIGSAARQMEGLLKGIMAYSRVGASTEEPTCTRASEVLDKALESLEGALQLSGAHIVRGELPEIMIPADHLLQLFQNLIRNAITFRGAAPLEIRISAAAEGVWWKFAIEDNGIGIRGEYLKQIFGIFRRLHKDEYPGVGVGLAICKRIIERAGGRIWAESEFGQGTTLFFMLQGAEEK